MRCFFGAEKVWVLDEVFLGSGRWLWVLDEGFFVLEGEFGGEGRNL